MQEKQKVKTKKRKVVSVPKSRKSALIRNTMTDFVEHAMEKAKISTKRNTANPFNLLPSNVTKIRRLERTYSTSAGSVLIQKLAAALAEMHLGYGRQNYTVIGRINTERMRRINNIMNSLESTGAKPNFKAELAYILDGKSKKTVQVVATADLYAVDRSGNHSRIAAECKSPLANNDQAKAAKEKILKLYAMEKPLVDEAYFVLNYNPFGDSREDFVWSPPSRWFNIKGGDPAVLIGAEFWDKIGGRGTYNLINSIAETVRDEYSDLINTKFVVDDNSVSVNDPKGLYEALLRLTEQFDEGLLDLMNFFSFE